MWLAEEGSGTELAAQNHSCLDRFAVELGLPLHYTSSRKELWLRAGSLCVPIVESVTWRGNPHTHQERCHWQEAGLLPPLVKTRTALRALSDSLQPSGWASVLDRYHRLGDLVGPEPGSLAGRWGWLLCLFTKSLLGCRLKIVLSLSLLTPKSPARS